MNNSINLTSQRIAFVNKIGILNKALTDDETPTPIYLYKEINDISYESIGYCESLVEFLRDRLLYKSCHVKLKVLKLMKHLTDHGSSDFKLGLRHQVSIIKECTKFSGPPHPVHGNTPYVIIRNLAVELCEYLYNINPMVLKASVKGTQDRPNPLPKYGGMGPSRSGGAIQGFGNSPASQSKGIAGTILHEIEKLGTKLSETPADRQAAVLAKLNLSASTSNYQPPVVSHETEMVLTQDVTDELPDLSLKRVIEKPVSRYLPGQAGGGWNDDDEDDDDNEKSSIDEKHEKHSRHLTDESKEFGSGAGKESDLSKTNSHKETTELNKTKCLQNLNVEEQKLLDDLLKEHTAFKETMLYFLSNSAISKILQRMSGVRCGVIVDCLCHHLSGEDPCIMTKILQVLEGIIYSRQELINIDALALRCQTALVRCYHNSGQSVKDVRESDADRHHQWKTVQTKAAKVILILQQLSCHKDILSSSEIANQLFVSAPASASQHPPEVTSS